uniref:Transposase of ISCARN76, IS5 family IS5 group N terminal part n=1 Tax=mine drainage metagenome TaxID=410659 RepID=E6QHU8_9ZZZZ
MRQLTFATQPSFEKYARKSRREEFLSTMQAVLPWAELEARIAPHYPKAGKGRQPVGLSIMLRIYFLQHWFALSDPGAEDALFMSRRCCAASAASISGARRCRTKRRSSTSAICLKPMMYAVKCSMW